MRNIQLFIYVITVLSASTMFANPIRSSIGSSAIKYTSGDSKPYDAEVEYLQGDGASYIDINIKCEYGMAFHVNFLPTENDSWTSIAGVFSNSRLSLGAIRDWSYYGGKYISNGIGTGSTVYWQKCKFSANQRICQSAQGSFNYTWSPNPFPQIQIPMYLFALNNKGVAEKFFRGKITSFSITLDEIVIIDLIPVRKGNFGYMYDRVSGKLFRNHGTGSFIIGPDL